MNLTEAEEDLANNNDPNNNAFAVGSEEPMPDQNLIHERNRTQSDPRIVRPDDLLLEEADDFVANEMLNAEKSDEEVKDDLDRDIQLIQKLMPDKAHEEISLRIREHSKNPSRVQVVLNDFLEEAEREATTNSENQVKFKNKSGNGLKSKNSKKFKQPNQKIEANNVKLKRSILSLDPNLDDESPLSIDDQNYAVPPKKKKSEIDDDDPMEGSSSGPVFKKPREEELYDPQEGSSRSSLGSRTPPEPSSTSVGIKQASANSTSSKSNSNFKIELTEDHFHGPFDFSAHRKKTQPKNNRRPDDPPEDSNEIIVEKIEKKSKEPPIVVDLEASLIDIAEETEQDKRASSKQLTHHFRDMFPDTSREYLDEMVEELTGKPAAIDRFITEHLERGCQPPAFWVSKSNPGAIHHAPEFPLPNIELDNNDSVVQATEPPREELAPPQAMAAPVDPTEATALNEVVDIYDPVQAPTVNEVVDIPEDPPAVVPDEESMTGVETEEERIQNKWSTLQILFPQTDPEFLHLKLIEFNGDENALNRWIDEGIETKGKDFPTRETYEKRIEEAELMEKYSQEVTVEEILEMYSDPEGYFADKNRKVSPVYKKHALAQLKKEFRTLSAQIINKIFTGNNCLYYPSYKSLQNQKNPSGKRKTKRPDHECISPQEIDINFLKELQFSRIELKVKAYQDELEEKHKLKVEEAKLNKSLVECVCCYNEECLIEEMLSCKGGHLYCTECVRRASEVAIGEEKTSLQCLGQCDENFELSTLQKALKAHMFSKWLRKIQLAEIQQADVDGLERCPFCEFATIMDTTPEENKIFQCQNPECGKETCRMCQELSHIPLRCEEVEKDSEVRKRTYIENKMTEALIRKCWSCKKPYLKQDGCNKISCSCGAQMCYLCRKPVNSYNHFFGQGAQPTKTQTCPLWSDNNSLHENEVARGAYEAKNEMEEKNPDIKLKHDPTNGVKKPATPPGGAARAHNPGAVPPGMEEILGNDPVQRMRVINQQRQIEAMVRQRQMGRQHIHAPPAAHDYAANIHNANLVNVGLIDDWQHDGLMVRMGQLLQARENVRQRDRDLRRREIQALEEMNRRIDPHVAQNVVPPPAGLRMPQPPPPYPHWHREQAAAPGGQPQVNLRQMVINPALLAAGGGGGPNNRYAVNQVAPGPVPVPPQAHQQQPAREPPHVRHRIEYRVGYENPWGGRRAGGGRPRALPPNFGGIHPFMAFNPGVEQPPQIRRDQPRAAVNAELNAFDDILQRRIARGDRDEPPAAVVDRGAGVAAAAAAGGNNGGVPRQPATAAHNNNGNIPRPRNQNLEDEDEIDDFMLEEELDLDDL